MSNYCGAVGDVVFAGGIGDVGDVGKSGATGDVGMLLFCCCAVFWTVVVLW